MRNVGFYWFGNDLRVHDNANLLKVDDLLCIYCLAAKATNTMTNILPQAANMNRGACCPSQ
jgi:deoxyribodipyrimidine photolyase